MENVNVILAGKEKSVHCVMMNAKYRTAMVMDTVLVGNAHVLVDTKGNFVKKVILNFLSSYI